MWGRARAWYRGPYKVEQWKGLTSARAHENLAYLVAADQAGDRFIGHSVVVNPWGHALVDLGEGERALTAELDPSEVREAVRGLELARWDLYARWYARGGSP
jgi:predicted amidohydrolase